ncbi:hypothetical protein PanWU01x14_165990 [Parasponia andersonii]|uniref:Uncharacterized protein n=1 Tax=Parasponia andersonii TaxID=3476 RepID=A0A2P5CC10_PARAD|nr:hypothetical protein PanWU01x14_165990 [Parasponia andersonii]
MAEKCIFGHIFICVCEIRVVSFIDLFFFGRNGHKILVNSHIGIFLRTTTKSHYVAKTLIKNNTVGYHIILNAIWCMYLLLTNYNYRLIETPVRPTLFFRTSQ